MPIQARAIAAALALAAMTGAAQAGCAKDEDLGPKLAAAGFLVEAQEPISAPKDMVFPPLPFRTPLRAEVRVLLIIAPDGTVADRVVLCAEPYGYFEATVLHYAKSFAFAPLPAGALAKYRTFVFGTKFKVRYEVPRFASPSRLDP